MGWNLIAVDSRQVYHSLPCFFSYHWHYNTLKDGKEWIWYMNIYIYSKIYAYSQHMSTLCRLANLECLSGLINGGRHHDHHEIDSESFFLVRSWWLWLFVTSSCQAGDSWCPLTKKKFCQVHAESQWRSSKKGLRLDSPTPGVVCENLKFSWFNMI